MKKMIYQKMYDCLSTLSYRFNSKLLTKVKVMLGAALLVLAGSCNDSDGPEVTCYITVSPGDTLEIQTKPVPDTFVEVEEMEE